ncbi:MAG: sugar transferase [Synechococcales cyanobacterium RM1_1_8]|nr:sugar transferase [Synechococcales cyanobacterium RM1_1_8]
MTPATSSQRPFPSASPNAIAYTEHPAIAEAVSPLRSYSIALQALSLKVHPSAHSRLKRWIDLCGAVLGLGCFGLVLPWLAIAIRLDGKGSIFYRQKRCGLRGKSFYIWKLRTMVPNAEILKKTVENQAKGFIFKNENDPRITRVGRFLRKTSLDEFPQFWNVIKGEMSLVGTRPPTLDEVSRYRPHHWQRLQVKPGITGEWQAKGRSSVDDFETIVAMDMEYQARWSIAYDLRLIWMTIGAVIQRRGAC